MTRYFTLSKLKHCSPVTGYCIVQKSLEAGEAGDTVRHEASEVRRLLLERDTQARVAQLKLTTLQRSLQEKQSEVSGCTYLHHVHCSNVHY